ncbi:hypothetical protein GCM10009848_52750 [Micromonospora lupini]
MSSGQEKDRFEQTMNASDMRVTSEGGWAGTSRPTTNGDRWNDDMATAAAPTRAEPLAEHVRSHPEMSSSPAMSGLPGRTANQLRRV